MKAAIVVKPGVLEVRDIPMPEVGEYDVLCQLLYGAVCTGTDSHILRGTFPFSLNYPAVLGHESIGRAVRLGPKVRNIKTGDLITRVGTPPPPDKSCDIAWGGFAEYGIAKDYRAMRDDGWPRSDWDAYRVCQVLPPDMDPRAATMVITWRETLSYITRMGIGLATAGAAVLVLGSGGNALSFVAHARNLGAGAIVMIGSKNRFQAGAAAGATCLDYHDTDAQLMEACDRAVPGGFHFVIDVVGRKGQIDRVLPLVRSGGTIGIYGIDEFFSVSLNPRRARGTFTFYNGHYDEEETHERVMAFVKSGALDPAIWLDMENPFDFDNICEAFQAVAARTVVKPLVRLSPKAMR